MNCTNCTLLLGETNMMQHNLSHANVTGLSPSKLSVQVWAALTSILSLTGASTSGVILLLVWKVETGSRWLIMNYLLLQFITSAVNAPVTIYMTSMKTILNVNPPDVCQFFQLLYLSTERGIDWANLCLAVQRIVAVRFPLKYRKVAKDSFMFGMIIFTWLAAVCPNIPYLFGVGGYFSVTPAGRCGVKVTLVPLYTIATWLPFGFVMLSAMYLSATLVGTHINAQQTIQPQSHTGALRAKRRRAQAWGLLGAIVIDGLFRKTWFIIGLYFPHIFVRYPLLSLVSRTSVVVESILAPVMVCLMYGKYRRRLRHYSPTKRHLPSDSTTRVSRQRNPAIMKESVI